MSDCLKPNTKEDNISYISVMYLSCIFCTFHVAVNFYVLYKRAVFGGGGDGESQ
jgi:hypothetical protein